jgi:hypothetical protein
MEAGIPLNALHSPSMTNNCHALSASSRIHLAPHFVFAMLAA